MELTTQKDDSAPESPLPGGLVVGGLVVGGSGERIWGMTSAQRLERIFKRAGVGAPAPGAVVAAHAGWVFDESLIKALAKRPGVILVDDAGVAVAVHARSGEDAVIAGLGAAPGKTKGYEALTALEVGSAYNNALRKREPPVLVPLTAGNVRAVEARLFQGSYKGVTDLVTKYVWPTPARIVTRWCAVAGVTPNTVTMASFLWVLIAFIFFWGGHFGVGLVAAWIMTFLDTVDGKLARVTLTSSKIGNVFDHGIDLIHPPFWWWAWLVGVQASPHPIDTPTLVLAVIVGGYIAQRVTEGIFLALFKLEMHAWRRFDSFFRLITARRNPNLILLTVAALCGRPDLGLLAVAAWTAVSLIVHVAQVLQGLVTPRAAIVSWMAR